MKEFFGICFVKDDGTARLLLTGWFPQTYYLFSTEEKAKEELKKLVSENFFHSLRIFRFEVK